MTYQGQIVGYCRVSSHGQSYEIQKEAVLKAGATRIFEEKASATTLEARPQLAQLREYIREGDTVVVTKIDRLARSISDFQDIVKDFRARGVKLQLLDQRFDATTLEGAMLLNLLAVFAEFETGLRQERQKAGIAKARAQGRSLGGRKRTIDRESVLRLKNAGQTPMQIVRELGVSRKSVYLIIKDGAKLQTPPQTAQIPLDAPSLFD